MNRQEIIRILFIGGQAAIGAELIAIIGLLFFLVAYADLVADLQTNSNTFDAIEDFVEVVNDNNELYVIGTMLSLAVPTVAMMIVVWTWHLYFEFEGVHLMNWVASSLAVMGGGLMLACVGVNVWSFGLLYGAYEDGRLTVEFLYTGFAIAEGLQIMATFVLYILYPMVLAFASWRGRLLPTWFLVATVIFVVLNDINFVYGTRYSELSVIAQASMVLLPFMMGVALLTKAQSLSRQAYIDKHGTPPPPTWGSVTPPTH